VYVCVYRVCVLYVFVCVHVYVNVYCVYGMWYACVREEVGRKLQPPPTPLTKVQTDTLMSPGGSRASSPHV